MMVNNKLYMGDKTCKTPFFYQTKSHKISQFSTKMSNKLIVKTKNYNLVSMIYIYIGSMYIVSDTK